MLRQGLDRDHVRFRPRGGSDQVIDLLIADIEAAKFVEREVIGDAQPQDLPMQQQIQPSELCLQMIPCAVGQIGSLRKKCERPVIQPAESIRVARHTRQVQDQVQRRPADAHHAPARDLVFQ